MCVYVCLSELSCFNRSTFEQKAITLKFGVKGSPYRSEGFVDLSLIRGACADNLADVVDRLLIYGRGWCKLGVGHKFQCKQIDGVGKISVHSF